MGSRTEERSPHRDSTEGVERVVLAADDTHGAIAAASWLTERARRHPLRIEIAVVEGAVHAGHRGTDAHETAEGVAWGMREYLAARIPAARTEVSVLRGPVVPALQEAGRGCDLLVLGCNRTRSMRHLPLASRSTRIAEAGRCPTVLVPATWVHADGPVVASVASRGGDAVVDWAAQEAAGTGRELLLVRGNLLPWMVGMPPGPALDVMLLDDVDAHLLAREAARVERAHPALRVRLRLDHEGLVPELVEEGRTASLLVLGAQGGPAFGSVLRGVLEQAPCPIVVVPDPDRG